MAKVVLCALASDERDAKKKNTLASQSAEVIICMRIKGRSKAHTPSARLKKASSSRWQQKILKIFHFLMEEIFQSASVSVTLYLHTACLR
jgi:hypothetical protein